MGMVDAMEEKMMLTLILSRFAQPVWTPLFGRLILVEPIPQSQPTISSRMMADLLMTTELLRLFGIWKSPQEQLPSVGEFSETDCLLRLTWERDTSLCLRIGARYVIVKRKILATSCSHAESLGIYGGRLWDGSIEWALSPLNLKIILCNSLNGIAKAL